MDLNTSPYERHPTPSHGFFFVLFVTSAVLPPIVLSVIYGQRGAILRHCERLPLVRYYHAKLRAGPPTAQPTPCTSLLEACEHLYKGAPEMAGKKRGPTPGTPQAKHGGEAVKAKYGSAYYAEIGKKGGAATHETYGPEHYSEIGKKGGTVTTERYGSEHYSRIGTTGGKVEKRHGSRLPDVP